MSKDAVINVRARRADLELIDRAASVLGKTRSAFIRECAEKDAHAVLRKSEQE